MSELVKHFSKSILIFLTISVLFLGNSGQAIAGLTPVSPNKSAESPFYYNPVSIFEYSLTEPPSNLIFTNFEDGFPGESIAKYCLKIKNEPYAGKEERNDMSQKLKIGTVMAPKKNYYNNLDEAEQANRSAKDISLGGKLTYQSTNCLYLFDVLVDLNQKYTPSGLLIKGRISFPF